MSFLRRLFRRDKSYREKDFRGREAFRDAYQRIARHLLDELEFESVFDVGCANGFLLEEMQASGKRAGGIELSPAVVAVLPESLRGVVRIGDFAAAEGEWDLVCCVEVAEHIEPERSEPLVDKVCALARHHVYFSAAPPGQGGRGHINCRPHEEWLAWFAARGWRSDDTATARLRGAIETFETVPWLAENSLLLRPASRA